MRRAAQAAAAKKAANLVLLDLRKLAGFTDYFLICQGNNQRQVQTIADEIDRILELEFRLSPAHREGYQHAEWVILDYVDFVVHIFLPASREFYGLERLWAKAPRPDLKLDEPQEGAAPA